MPLAFPKILASRRNQVIAIVLGTRTTKAVYLKRHGTGFCLLNYALLETPALAQGLSCEVLTEHFKKIKQLLEAETNQLVVVIGMGDSLLRNTELPPMPVADMRKLLKFNTRNYFQQDLPDYVFDCHILPFKTGEAPTSSARQYKHEHVLVGGVRGRLVDDLDVASRAAGFVPVQITLSQISLANAASLAMGDVVNNEVVALVDLGFITSTISVLVNGELMLTRVVGIGGDRLTSGLAEALNITYLVAEGIKQVMPEKVHAKLQSLMHPLGQEMRAAIDFFEAQYDKRIHEVYVAGGSAKSDLIVQTLQEMLALPCKRWNPTAFLERKLPSQKAGEIEKDALQLATAIGAAAAWLSPEQTQLNLLAEKIDEQKRRKMDPVRHGALLAGVLLLLLLAWAGQLWIKLWVVRSDWERNKTELKMKGPAAGEASANARAIVEIEGTLMALNQVATNRFLWAAPLNELQFAMVRDIQVLRLRLDQQIIRIAATKPRTNENNIVTPGRPAATLEKITMTIQAKDTGEPPASDRFIEAIAANPYFRNSLRKENPVRLLDRGAPQVDPLNPSKTFIMFTIECSYPERAL